MPTLRELLISRQRDCFTDREGICDTFSKLICTPAPLRLYRILALYGPGGIGKSMLMREFRDICNDNGIASSIANMDICSSPLDLLMAFRESWELCPSDRPFREFDSLLARFNDLPARIQRRDRTEEKLSKTLEDILGDISTAAVGGAVAGLPLGPMGALMSAAGGALTHTVLESTIARLLKNGLISDRDADFLINLLPKLVSTFVQGTKRLADKEKGVVLILDAYEYAQKSKHLSVWITESLLPNLSDRTFAVVSGRNRLTGKFWQTYSRFVCPHRLQPFTKPDIIKYLSTRGMNTDRSEALLDLTAGLPLGAALWADIETQRRSGLFETEDEHRSVEVVEIVVGRLLEHLDDASKQVIRICAIPRHIDEVKINLLLPNEDVNLVFDRLTRYSSLFRLRSNGLAMHDEVRRFLLEDFRRRNINLYRDCNWSFADIYHSKRNLFRNKNALLLL